MIHGQCLTVGVGGFLLKGGFNMLGGSARYGDGSSHVVRYTMVDVNGDILRVDGDGVTKYDLKGNEARSLLRSKMPKFIHFFTD